MKEKNIRDFVPYIMEEKKSNDQLVRAFWGADDPNRKYHSWRYLCDFIDLEDDDAREMLEIIGNSIVRFDIEEDGCDSLGKACQALSYEGELPARLLFLLSTDEIKSLLEELQAVLRCLSNKINNLSFQMLLDDLLDFKKDPESVKLRWAKAFYERDSDEAS